MAAAARSFGPEREAEPAKEARVVGSELVDTYTVWWGRGYLKRGWRWEPGVRVQGRGEGSAVMARGPRIGESGESAASPQVQEGPRAGPGRGFGRVRGQKTRLGLEGIWG